MNDRFTIGLDLDGVVADYVAGFRPYAAKYLGVDESTLPDPVNWSFVESGWFDTLEDYLDAHGRAVSEGLFLTAPPIKDAVEVLQRLSQQEIHIIVVTHRLVTKNIHSTAISNTVAWLDAHQIPYRDICFLKDKASIQADVFIDDAPHNIENLQAGGHDTITFAQLYNEDTLGERVDGWGELETLLLKKASVWANEKAAA